MGGSQLSSSSSHIHSLQNAQDILEIMATNSMDSNVLQDMATILTANNDSDIGIHEAGKIAYTYLNKTIKNSKYSLMETKQTNRVIASNGDMENAGNVSVGFKSYKGYVFKLYIWKQIPY